MKLYCLIRTLEKSKPHEKILQLLINILDIGQLLSNPLFLKQYMATEVSWACY